MVSWSSTWPCLCQQHTVTQDFIQGFLCSSQHLSWCCLWPHASYILHHACSCLLDGSRGLWRPTVGGEQQLDGRGKRVNIFSFVVCGLCGNHTTLTVAQRQPSTAQPLGVVPAQILFPQANNTVEVWTCLRGGLSINIPVAMVAATPWNLSVRLRSLSVK